MPALAPYIPVRDTDWNSWFQNFSALISAAPSTYGLLPSDATTIAALFSAWSADYALITSPSTKTAAAVSAKNTQKVTALAQVRVYAQVIALNPGVLSADKIALGLNPRTSLPSPITPPASNPVLLLQSLGNLTAVLRYRDSAASVSVKSKPFGVTQLRLFGKTSTTPIVDAAGLPLVASMTKSPTQIMFSPDDAGKQMYLVGQWAIRTGAVSPWSPFINFTIPTAG